jgi:hypothetical protein
MGITTSTEYGRQGILWPDFAHEGGSALHGKITSSIAAISNNITTKWTGEQTLADGASFSFEHNFGMALGELSVAIYVAGAFVQEGSSAQWTLAQVDTNNITITNNTGSSATFFAYVMGFNIEKIIGDASATSGGLVTAVSQAFAGLKTFEDGIASDTIAEKTLDAGVNIDGLNVKDGNLTGLEVSQLEQQSATPATPDSGKSKFYVKEDGVAYILNSDGVETPVGSGSTIERVSHTSHGFIVGNVLYDAGANFAKGNCADSAKAEVIAMVSRVIDANTFEVITDGIPSSGLVAACFKGGVLPADGDVCFLSDEDGKLTTVDPNEGPVGNISKPLFFVRSVDATYAYGYFKNMRGTTVGGANLYTTIPVNGSISAPVTTSFHTINTDQGTGGWLSGTIKIDATTDYSIPFFLMFSRSVDGASYDVGDIRYGNTIPSGMSISNSGSAIQITLPSIAGFSSAAVTYCVQAAAQGTTLPVNVSPASITGAADITMASGYGINFGNETLKEYDEGTWTPTLSVTGTLGNFAATAPHASYTRIGNKVFFQLEIQCTQSSTATGQIQSTLPFTPARSVAGWGFESSNTAKGLGVLISSTRIELRFADGTSTTGTASTRYFYVSGAYTIA